MAAGMKKARKQWLVLFDIDGTLLDTHGAGREAFVRGLARWSGVRDELADVSFAGNTDRNVLDQVAATRGWRLGPADIQRIFGFIAEELRQLLQDSPARAIAGAHDLLGRLTTAGAALGLVTGNIRVCAYLKLGSVGFDRFSASAASATTIPNGPDRSRGAGGRARGRHRPGDHRRLPGGRYAVRCRRRPGGRHAGHRRGHGGLRRGGIAGGGGAAGRGGFVRPGPVPAMDG